MWKCYNIIIGNITGNDNGKVILNQGRGMHEKGVVCFINTKCVS